MSTPTFSDQNFVNGLEFSDLVSDHEFAFLPNDPNPSDLAPSWGTSSEEGNVSDAVLKCISQMLMEDEDLEYRLSVLQDSLALQAAEKSLYDVLGEKYPSSPNHYQPLICEYAKSPGEDFTRTCSSHSSDSSTSLSSITDSNWNGDQNKFGSSLLQSSHVNHTFEGIIQSDFQISGSSNTFCEAVDGTMDSLLNSFQVLDPSKESQAVSQFKIQEGELNQILSNKRCVNYDLERNEKTPKVVADAGKCRKEQSPSGTRVKRSHFGVDGDCLEGGRSNKQLAGYAEEIDEPSEMYDNVLLCHGLNPHFHKESDCLFDDEASRNGAGGKLKKNAWSKGSSRGRPRGKKQGNRKEVVDLMTLLTQCAQAVASNDSRAATELLKQIREHSSPHGDGTERMAYFIANALETRLAGTGRALDASLLTRRLSAADTLKAYRAYLTACPLKKLANFFANQLIGKLAEKATRIHIIDFGIIHGFQWPHLIQHLSLRPGGPPAIRITGIDFPQPGFRPAERVEETGNRLAYYCERFNIQFEFNGIAKKWDTIQLEDLKIERDEVLVVNCLYRLRYVPDETVAMRSPRDAVLNLIKRMNPDMFIHGIVNGTYNTPFFVSRFREALYQFSSFFDMFDAFLPREDQGRMLFEEEILGRAALSVIACEGTERVIRPETYKQWQVRNMRAGLRQLPLDQEIMKNVRAKVKLSYHKDFVVEEDSNWMLQGWKGRTLSALSCWKPAQEI